jgi:hypothetical protein
MKPFLLGLCLAGVLVPQAGQTQQTKNAKAPLLLRLAGERVGETTRTLGKPSPGAFDGDLTYPGKALRCDAVYVFERKGIIESITAAFKHPLTWQAALKKVGISEEGVTATVKSFPMSSGGTHTLTTLQGRPLAKSGFGVTFADASGEWRLIIKKR